MAGRGGTGPRGPRCRLPWAGNIWLRAGQAAVVRGCNPNQRSAGYSRWKWGAAAYSLHRAGARAGAGSQGHMLARVQGGLCTQEAKFASQVTVLRLEVRILWYFNKEVYMYIFVKGHLAFSLLACGEGPVALSQDRWGHLMAAGICSPPPHLVPEPGTG